MSAHRKKPCILIVDDDYLIRDLIKEFLDDYDLELLEAVNGQQAVSMACAYNPDLILLDIQMPVMNGYTTAAILKNYEAVKNIPILIITGQEHGEVAARISGMHDGYMRKPFEKDHLVKATLQFLPGILNTKAMHKKTLHTQAAKAAE